MSGKAGLPVRDTSRLDALLGDVKPCADESYVYTFRTMRSRAEGLDSKPGRVDLAVRVGDFEGGAPAGLAKGLCLFHHGYAGLLCRHEIA